MSGAGGMTMCDRSHLSEQAMDSRVRRAARRVGLEAIKSRCRVGTIDNLGGYRLIDPWHNVCVEGERFDLSAEYVIEVCESKRDSEEAA